MKLNKNNSIIFTILYVYCITSTCVVADHWPFTIPKKNQAIKCRITISKRINHVLKNTLVMFLKKNYCFFMNCDRLWQQVPSYKLPSMTIFLFLNGLTAKLLAIIFRNRYICNSQNSYWNANVSKYHNQIIGNILLQTIFTPNLIAIMQCNISRLT